ncbi:hypothetical protein Tsubulata_009511 [Turnera subulata]|uniref:Uncharacterized protein n=1 Tax=Turnera subulata TaxID=218843 RepID=A0A9Q0FAM4_9ROSI|nr:hypothetical protein Tsubulata_009511 [Turnera subulata]
MVLMDKDAKDANGLKNRPLISVEDEKHEDPDNGEDYSELNSLLPPRRGGMSRNSDKVRRKVQWNDNNGNKLAEVLEFVPRFGIN